MYGAVTWKLDLEFLNGYKPPISDGSRPDWIK
jgi:hypothetical protein